MIKVTLENCNETEWETLKKIASFHESICFVDACRVIVKPKTVEVWNEDDTYFRFPNYLNDLNSLVPVWRKLRVCLTKSYLTCVNRDFGSLEEHVKFVLFIDDTKGWSARALKVNQAAALATAKAIVELNQ